MATFIYNNISILRSRETRKYNYETNQILSEHPRIVKYKLFFVPTKNYIEIPLKMIPSPRATYFWIIPGIWEKMSEREKKIHEFLFKYKTIDSARTSHLFWLMFTAYIIQFLCVSWDLDKKNCSKVVVRKIHNILTREMKSITLMIGGFVFCDSLAGMINYFQSHKFSIHKHKSFKRQCNLSDLIFC